MAQPRTCPRHPDVETRLRCSACDEPICPRCGQEAAVGYQCPDCAGGQRESEDAPASLRRLVGRLGPDRDGAGGASDDRGGEGPLGTGGGGADSPSELPTVVGARATVVGLVAAGAAGLLIGPVLSQGTFFLISSGVLGWLVARAVFWASRERVTPYLRALALVCAGLLVAVGQASAMGPDGMPGLAVIAYPAALYGGWIVVRQR